MSEVPRAEYIPLEELPAEEREGLKALETKTDEIYRLRGELASFYREYGFAYLRRMPVSGEKKFGKRPTVKDITSWLVSGTPVDELIDDAKILETLKKEGVSPKNMDVMREVRRDEVMAALAVAVASYQELEAQGGAFGGREPSEEDKDMKSYYDIRWGELGGARKIIDDVRAKVALIEAKMEQVRSNPKLFRHAALVLDRYEDEYETLFEEIQKLVEENPEAYFLVRAEELADAKRIYDERGTIVETPYVKSKLAHMRDLVRRGRPIFIHGELGSGKTELAKHYARRELSSAHLVRWEVANPAPEDKNSDAYRAWVARRAEEAEALIIPGYKGIEAEQLLAARAISPKEAPSPEEQARRIAEGWQVYRERLITDVTAQDLSADDLGAFTKKIDEVDRPLYEKAYLEAFRAPVETRVVLAPVLRAMREGRPVIIDEMNAIPHHALIILNDYLLKRPGDWVTPPFPGAEPFQVQEGFAVVATGNYKPEDGVMYVGRQPVDAAFLSRWGLISYDYLPMSRELEAPGMPPERLREVRRENELHHMLVTRLLHADLSARLPEGAIEEIRKLSVVARNLEDIFSGQPAATAYYADLRGTKVKPQEILKENVLSIRHLIPIIDQWQSDGFTRPLADYLFMEYVERSNARPNEKVYLYQILKVQGDFFPDDAGWPSLAHPQKIVDYPIEAKMYGTSGDAGMRAPVGDAQFTMRTYSPIEVIEALFGPRPERKNVPASFARRKEEKPPPPEDDHEKLDRLRLVGEIGGLIGGLRSEQYTEK